MNRTKDTSDILFRYLLKNHLIEISISYVALKEKNLFLKTILIGEERRKYGSIYRISSTERSKL